MWKDELVTRFMILKKRILFSFFASDSECCATFSIQSLRILSQPLILKGYVMELRFFNENKIEWKLKVEKGCEKMSHF